MGAFQIFHDYMGTGLLMIWYLLAVAWLFLKEKRKPVRILFLYLPGMVLLFFFNPLLFALYERVLKSETYFRMLWLLPVSATLGYCIVAFLRELSGKKKLLFGGISVVAIMVTGTLVYQNPLFTKAENRYHVPWEVVEICDRISIDGREVMAAFPEEFLLYVRQYTAAVCMPYGRQNMQDTYDEFYLLMLRKEIPVSEMAALAKEELCHYVIVSRKKVLVGNMQDYGYELFGEVGDYLIYRDNTMDFRNTMD